MVPGMIYSKWSLAEQHRNELLEYAEMCQLARLALTQAEPRTRPSLRSQFASVVAALIGAIAMAFQPTPLGPRGFRDGLW